MDSTQARNTGIEMESLTTEPSKDEACFTYADYLEIDRICPQKGSKMYRLLSNLLSGGKPLILYELQRIYLEYEQAKLVRQYDVPTQKKHDNTIEKLLKSSTNLLRELLEAQNQTSFYTSMIIPELPQNRAHDFESEEAQKVAQNKKENIAQVAVSINWLIKQLEFSKTQPLQYPYVRSTERTRPETKFFREISAILTKEYESGGFWSGDYSDQNSARGWRIDALEYLGKRAGITATRNQILEAIR